MNWARPSDGKWHQIIVDERQILLWKMSTGNVSFFFVSQTSFSLARCVRSKARGNDLDLDRWKFESRIRQWVNSALSREVMRLIIIMSTKVDAEIRQYFFKKTTEETNFPTFTTANTNENHNFFKIIHNFFSNYSFSYFQIFLFISFEYQRPEFNKLHCVSTGFLPFAPPSRLYVLTCSFLPCNSIALVPRISSGSFSVQGHSEHFMYRQKNTYPETETDAESPWHVTSKAGA